MLEYSIVNKGPSANRLASWRGGRNYVLPMHSEKLARPLSTLFCSNIEFEQYVLFEDTDPLKSNCAVETPTVEKLAVDHFLRHSERFR
jgi:hypothetical protein